MRTVEKIVKLTFLDDEESELIRKFFGIQQLQEMTGIARSLWADIIKQAAPVSNKTLTKVQQVIEYCKRHINDPEAQRKHTYNFKSKEGTIRANKIAANKSPEINNDDPNDYYATGDSAIIKDGDNFYQDVQNDLCQRFRVYALKPNDAIKVLSNINKNTPNKEIYRIEGQITNDTENEVETEFGIDESGKISASDAINRIKSNPNYFIGLFEDDNGTMVISFKDDIDVNKIRDSKIKDELDSEAFKGAALNFLNSLDFYTEDDGVAVTFKDNIVIIEGNFIPYNIYDEQNSRNDFLNKFFESAIVAEYQTYNHKNVMSYSLNTFELGIAMGHYIQDQILMDEGKTISLINYNRSEDRLYDKDDQQTQQSFYFKFKFKLFDTDRDELLKQERERALIENKK